MPGTRRLHEAPLPSARACTLLFPRAQVEGCGKGFVDRALLTRHERTHSTHRPFVCTYEGCNKAFKVMRKPPTPQAAHALVRSPMQVQKHLDYHLQLHEQPDAFACNLPGCGKIFSNPSSLRIHRVLAHERPGQETDAESELREALLVATTDLEAVKAELHEAQQRLSATLAQTRDLRKQVKQREPHLQALRRENNHLTATLGLQPDLRFDQPALTPRGPSAVAAADPAAAGLKVSAAQLAEAHGVAPASIVTDSPRSAAPA